MRGCPAWRRYYEVHFVLPTGDELFSLPRNVSSPPPRPRTLQLRCSHCDLQKEVAHITLYKQRKWKQLLCAGCFRLSSSRLWRCPCGGCWVGCPLHASSGFACGHFSQLRRATHAKLNRVSGGDTNHVPPPSADDTPPCKRVRHSSMMHTHLNHNPRMAGDPPRRSDKRRLSSEGHSAASAEHSGPVLPRVARPKVASPSSPHSGAGHARGTKRAAPARHHSSRPKPKAKRRSTGLDAVGAINRLRESWANPL